MSYLDIAIVITLVIAFILGFKDGIIRKLIGTVGFFIAVILGIVLSKSAGDLLNSITGIEPTFAEVLAGFFVFIVVVVLVSIIKRIVNPFDKINNLVNRILGGVAGVIQIAFFISAVLYILNVFKLPGQESKDNSFLYSPFYNFLPAIVNQLETVTPDAKKSIKEFLIEKDSI